MRTNTYTPRRRLAGLTLVELMVALSIGSFLVIGFILHNITEGIGIAAPITRDNPKLRTFLLLLLLSGSRRD